MWQNFYIYDYNQMSFALPTVTKHLLWKSIAISIVKAEDMERVYYGFWWLCVDMNWYSIDGGR